jgi:type I restriction enzyme S subunit
LAGGDVVIAVRGSYERTAVVPNELNDANLSRDVARLAPLPELLPELLHYWLQTSSSKAYLNRHARGVAVKGVNISTLRAMPVPLLPLDIQRRIVDTVNTQLAAGDRATLEIDQAAKRSGKLRRSLLAAAFAGRLTGQATDMEIVKEMTSV